VTSSFFLVRNGKAKHFETFYHRLSISAYGFEAMPGSLCDAIMKHFRLSRGAFKQKEFPTSRDGRTSATAMEPREILISNLLKLFLRKRHDRGSTSHTRNSASFQIHERTNTPIRAQTVTDMCKKNFPESIKRKERIYRKSASFR